MSWEIQNYLTCEADFDREGGWIGDVPDESQPPGRDSIGFLHSVLLSETCQLSEIWNEEWYGWSFNIEREGITLNILVQYVDHWLILCSNVSLLPRFLRSSRHEVALKFMCDRIDRTIRDDARFRHSRWLTASEYAEFEKHRRTRPV